MSSPNVKAPVVVPVAEVDVGAVVWAWAEAVGRNLLLTCAIATLAVSKIGVP